MTDFVVAESGIRQLHARFADAVWRKDADAFADCFTRDAEWKIAGLHIHGREEIGGLIGNLLYTYERVLLILGTPILEVGDGAASGRIQITEFAKMGDGSSAMTLGVYYDRYVQDSDRWRFQWRHYGLHYRGPADLSEAFVECPDYGPPPGLPAEDEPTFTRRPQGES